MTIAAFSQAPPLQPATRARQHLATIASTTQRMMRRTLRPYGEYKIGRAQTLENGQSRARIDILAIDPAAEKPTEWPRYGPSA